MATPSFTFRLERVRDLREAALDLDRQDAEVETRRRALTAAASLGVTNVHDPAQALEGGAKYLRRQLRRVQANAAGYRPSGTARTSAPSVSPSVHGIV